VKWIPLTQGKEAIVDDCDYDHLMQWRWFYHWKGRSTGYAQRAEYANGQQNKVYLHRVVAERCGLETVGRQIDHVDGDGLNNCRNNLRVATNRQNAGNQKRQCNNTSGFNGVVWAQRERKWRARIGEGGRQHLGYFDDPRDAARAYNEAAMKHFGEFACLNPV
jgi:hypothetical protein